MREFPKIDSPLLADALDFVGNDAKKAVLDAVYCELHNKGYNIEGNTEANDLEWFARNLYERRYEQFRRWDALEEKDKDEWRRIAEASLQILPQLMGKVASRCIHYSQALHLILKQTWEQKNKVKR